MQIPGFIRGAANRGNKAAQAFVQQYDNGDNTPYDPNAYAAVKAQFDDYNGELDDNYEEFDEEEIKSPKEQRANERINELGEKYKNLVDSGKIADFEDFKSMSYRTLGDDYFDSKAKELGYNNRNDLSRDDFINSISKEDFNRILDDNNIEKGLTNEGRKLMTDANKAGFGDNYDPMTGNIGLSDKDLANKKDVIKQWISEHPDYKLIKDKTGDQAAWLTTDVYENDEIISDNEESDKAPFVVIADGKKYLFDTEREANSFIERNKYSFDNLKKVNQINDNDEDQESQTEDSDDELAKKAEEKLSEFKEKNDTSYKNLVDYLLSKKFKSQEEANSDEKYKKLYNQYEEDQGNYISADSFIRNHKLSKLGGSWTGPDEDMRNGLKKALGIDKNNTQDFNKSQTNNQNINSGKELAKRVAKAFKGESGPFGGEDPIVRGNQVTFYSQGGDETYRFNDDGSIDWLNVEDAVDAWIQDNEIEEDERDEAIEQFSHFNSFQDLANSGLTRFIDLDDKTMNKILGFKNKIKRNK